MKLPRGWTKMKVQDLIDRFDAGVSVNGGDRPANGNEPGILKVSAVTAGKFLPVENKMILSKETQRVNLSPKSGRIIMSRANTPELVGANAYIDCDYPLLFLSDKLWQFEPKCDIKFSMRWLSLVLGSPMYRKKIGEMATGTSSSMKNISQASVMQLDLLVPAYEEQQAIAKTLTAWNQAIVENERLIEIKKIKKGKLANLLLFGKSRLTANCAPWRKLTLKQITAELRERNSEQMGAESVMGVNKLYGLIPMKEDIIGSQVDRYKVVPPKAFAYNPMRINIGSIARSEFSSNVLVSPDYVVFKCLEGRCDPDFLNHYRRTQAWESFVKSAGNGSVRVRIYYNDLAAMKMKMPPLEEQKDIARVLNIAEKEIELTQKMLDAIKKQKRGLMQKLLTGEWRVKTMRK